MPYKVTLHCDEETCKNEAEVPQVGAAPAGWILLSFIKPKLGHALAPEGVEPVTKTFCSWPCLHKFTKARVRGIENE